MRYKTSFFAVILSFIILLPPRVMSQDADESNPNQEASAPRGMPRSSKIIGPAVKDAHYASEKSARLATFDKCRENLSEFKEAQQFQRLKAVVFADVGRLKTSKRPQPDSLAGRGAVPHYQGAGSIMVNRGKGKSSSELPVQAKSAVLPVSLLPVDRSKRDLNLPDNRELAERSASNSH